MGDQVLAEVAAAVRAEVRDGDIVGRFGGEEFVVLLPDLDGHEAGAEVVAERIRRRVAALNIDLADVPGGAVIDHLTVSIGGAVFPVHGADLAKPLEVADTARYTAKRAGRNTVRMGPHAVPVGAAVRPTPYCRS
jgi:diguanylate cyclase (GGDEF)-like protein